MQEIIDPFQKTDEFRGLAARTQSDYVKIIKLIEKQFGDLPLEALTDRRTRGIFNSWRDKRAMHSRRQADYGWTVLARILSVAKDRGEIGVNPAGRAALLVIARR